MYYEDLDHYTSGIYTVPLLTQHTAGKHFGAHGVKIIGWGIENGIKYWLISNSWNTNWGEKGLFRMLRGYNECNIESRVLAGLPKL
ncbi:unnamed protein product [Strongylus vulgaris]|uniref:Peptidase C1A papain C-terminal domain-containing protein n=1 Tax=Strongylus vulgaris TaxID=40348 RepID=A0A3P7LI88_STRVU|nr:unnamed protein product [Strongylus vulgaris]